MQLLPREQGVKEIYTIWFVAQLAGAVEYTNRFSAEG